MRNLRSELLWADMMGGNHFRTGVVASSYTLGMQQVDFILFCFLVKKKKRILSYNRDKIYYIILGKFIVNHVKKKKKIRVIFRRTFQ